MSKYRSKPFIHTKEVIEYNVNPINTKVYKTIKGVNFTKQQYEVVKDVIFTGFILGVILTSIIAIIL